MIPRCSVPLWLWHSVFLAIRGSFRWVPIAAHGTWPCSPILYLRGCRYSLPLSSLLCPSGERTPTPSPCHQLWGQMAGRFPQVLRISFLTLVASART